MPSLLQSVAGVGQAGLISQMLDAMHREPAMGSKLLGEAFWMCHPNSLQSVGCVDCVPVLGLCL